MTRSNHDVKCQATECQATELFWSAVKTAAVGARRAGDGLEKLLFMRQVRATAETVSVGDAAGSVMAQAGGPSKAGTAPAGVTTGYDDLDRMTAGLQPGNLVVVAGRPGMGKSCLALNIAGHVAVREGLPVIVFSLEMTREEIAKRLICAEAGLNGDKLRFPSRMEAADWAPLSKAVDTLARAPLFIDDAFSHNIIELRRMALNLKHEQGGRMGLIVVDCLQQMHGCRREPCRDQEMSGISRALKALAKELSVPIIAVVQIDKALELRESKKPVMDDLRGSGSLDHDADVVIFVYRPWVYDQVETMKDQADIIIAKQRNGPTGSVTLRFVAEFVRFENIKETGLI